MIRLMVHRRVTSLSESVALREWARHGLTPTPGTVWDLAPDEPDNRMRVCRNDLCEQWFPLPPYRSGLPVKYCSLECADEVAKQRRAEKGQRDGWRPKKGAA